MTQSKNTASFFDTQYLQNLMPNRYAFDMSAVLELYRKNVEAFTELQQVTVEGLQNVAQCQSTLMNELVQQNTALTQQLLGEGTPEEKVARQADLIKTAYERSVTSLREISDVVSKTGTEAGEILNARITDSLETLGTVPAKVAKAEKTARKAA